MDSRLLEAIQYCYGSFVDKKNIMELGNDMMNRLLALTESKYGFIYDKKNSNNDSYTFTDGDNVVFNEVVGEFFAYEVDNILSSLKNKASD